MQSKFQISNDQKLHISITQKILGRRDNLNGPRHIFWMKCSGAWYLENEI